MKQFWHLVVPLTFIIAVTSGCATSGQFKSTHLTNVELSRKNFRVLATNVAGEATAGYLIGLSFGSGSDMSTFALIRVEGKGLLYKEALENLWKNFEDTHGRVAGRNLALVNVRYDASALNVLGLYTEPKVAVRADVVEFLEE